MTKHRRHLAAILFTDAPTISPRAEANEQDLLQGLRQYHDVLKAYHKKFRGRIVNFYGNYCISLFGCTLDAVRCARAMQKEFLTHGKEKVRMGLHIGEVLDEVHEVSGASVNLAARIQALGVPGSVVFSDVVYAQIRNQPEFKVIPLGRFAVKNITEKVSAYALNENGIVVPSRSDILKCQQIDMMRLLTHAPMQALFLLGRLVYTSLS